MTNPTPDAALLWAREQITKHAHESLHDAIDAGGWDRWETVHNRAEAFRAGQSHDAGLLAALEWYADPANYRTFHDEDGDESIPCIPCDLTPADEGGLRLSVYDCGDRARSPIAATREIDAEALRAEYTPDELGLEIADWLQQRANDVKEAGNG